MLDALWIHETCWMVEWFCEDRRIAFVTLSPEGRILERGPNQQSEPEEPTKEEASRIDAAAAEALELACRERYGPGKMKFFSCWKTWSEPTGFRWLLDPAKWLEEARIIGSYDLVALRWSAIEEFLFKFMWSKSREIRGKISVLSLEKGVWMDPDVLPGEATVYRLRCQQADGSWMSQRILQATASGAAGGLSTHLPPRIGRHGLGPTHAGRTHP